MIDDLHNTSADLSEGGGGNGAGGELSIHLLPGPPQLLLNHSHCYPAVKAGHLHTQSVHWRLPVSAYIAQLCAIIVKATLLSELGRHLHASIDGSFGCALDIVGSLLVEQHSSSASDQDTMLVQACILMHSLCQVLQILWQNLATCYNACPAICHAMLT